MASSGSLKPSLGMLHPAAKRHPKATHPWLLMGVQACRLPALKPSKPSKPSKRSKPLKSLKPLQRCWLGNPSPMLWETPMASSGRPSLPFASPKNFPTLQTLTLKLRHPKATHWHASSCSQQAPQGDTSIASYGRPSLPFASPFA